MGPSAGLDLTSFIADSLRESCCKQPDFQGCVIAGRRAISSAMVNDCDLDSMWRESDPDKRLPGKYRRHQVVSDPEWGFTVVVLLWEPGAITPIHDHDTWCVFGILEGDLEVTNYTVLEDNGTSPYRLREVGREVLKAGVTGDNMGADTEVHRVRNVGSSRAISLHVYGDDLTQRKLFFGRGIQVDGKGECFAFQQDPAY
jgi:predicted metal-dependent enzyme (double-stranded beta helix superfamily)